MTLSPAFHPPTFVVPAFFSSFAFSLLPVCLDALLSPTFLISLHRSLPTCRRCPLPPSTCPYPPTTLLLNLQLPSRSSCPRLLPSICLCLSVCLSLCSSLRPSIFLGLTPSFSISPYLPLPPFHLSVVVFISFVSLSSTAII